VLTPGESPGRTGYRLEELEHPFRSTLSFAFPSPVVCHCMLPGESEPPQASGTT